MLKLQIPLFLSFVHNLKKILLKSLPVLKT